MWMRLNSLSVTLADSALCPPHACLTAINPIVSVATSNPPIDPAFGRSWRHPPLMFAPAHCTRKTREVVRQSPRPRRVRPSPEKTRSLERREARETADPGNGQRREGGPRRVS
ncbi:unnamed protein product [Lota lota]